MNELVLVDEYDRKSFANSRIQFVERKVLVKNDTKISCRFSRRNDVIAKGNG